MTNPFSLLPYALAASNRAVGGVSMNTLVAAGFTLLQRSAPLVRTLATSRPALLLPPGASTLCALAACDGHVALLLDHNAPPKNLAQQLTAAGVGVVFTVARLADRLPSNLTSVLLDDIPYQAQVHTQGTERVVDLGSHVGLRLEGRLDVPLSDAAIASWFVNGAQVTISHAEALDGMGPLAWLRNIT